MNYRAGIGPQAKVTTIEEFQKWSGGGNGGGGEPPREPGTLEKKIRAWAKELIRREEKAIEDLGQVAPRLYVENCERLAELGEQFKKVADPDFEGTVEALKVLWDYGFGLRTAAQPS